MEPAINNNFRTNSRRGLTFIEVICAVAMLALVAASVLGAFNSMMAAQERQKRRLAAMELTNRLILQYLDDKDTMPQQGLPILSENERYHWEMNVVPVRLVPARPDVAEDRTNTSSVSVDRMEAITVTVWLSEESGGAAQFDARVPSATLTRLMDPIALRNPDTTNALAHDPTKQQELIAKFRTIARNAAPVKPATPGATTPPAGAKGAAPSSPGVGPAPIPSKGDPSAPRDLRLPASSPISMFPPSMVKGAPK